MKEPDSMGECVYFTNRVLDKNGFIKAWVLRKNCPKCQKGLMGKPKEKGKVKTRSTEYVCPECGYTVPEDEYESTLMICIKYKCDCGNSGELELPFQRKKMKRFDEETQKSKTVEAIKFNCQKCNKEHLITKKLK